MANDIAIVLDLIEENIKAGYEPMLAIKVARNLFVKEAAK